MACANTGTSLGRWRTYFGFFMMKESGQAYCMQ